MIHDEYEDSKKACLVCGHEMAPHSRVCDRCGSIRRPARPLGDRRPREHTGSCRRCGEPVSGISTICRACANLEKEKKARGRGRAGKLIRPSVVVLLTVSALAVAVGIVGLVGGRTDVLIASLTIGALVLLACGLLVFRIIRKGKAGTGDLTRASQR